MKYSHLILFFCASLLSQLLWADEEPTADETAQVRGIVQNLINDNAAFVKSHRPDYYKPFLNAQHPRATVVTCSDSRVHMHAMDKTPDGDLFVVRNIGNQISTSEGSVEYGVRHLHTPLLIIIGHSACGAVKAAYGDYSAESDALKHELDTLKLPPKNPENDENAQWLQGVKANVNYQVEIALKKFATEASTGRLTVIGAVYDFQNALQQGQGRLVITNINGNTDADSITAALKKFSVTAISSNKQPGLALPIKKSDH